MQQTGFRGVDSAAAPDKPHDSAIVRDFGRMRSAGRSASLQWTASLQWSALLLLCALLVFSDESANAQVPMEIGYQGVIQQAGAPLEGTHVLRIALYDAPTGGSPIFEETDTARLLNGTFNIRIGSSRPFPQTLTFDHGYFVGVTIDGSEELTPRTVLTSVPYALGAREAELAHGLASDAHGVVTSVNEVSGPLWIVGDSLTNVVQTAGQIQIHSRAYGIATLHSNGHTIRIVDDPRADSLDGPSAVPGRHLTIDLQDNAVTEQKLAQGAVTPAKLAQSGATTGQMLKWDGKTWAPADDKNTSYTGGAGISIVGNVITATGNPISGTTLNSTLRWSGFDWRENTNMLSDINGNTQIAGGLTVGNGLAQANIIFNPGSGSVSILGFGAGILHSDQTGLLSSQPLDLSSEVHGTLPVTMGGTGVTNFRQGELVVGNGIGPLTTARIVPLDGLSVTNAIGAIYLHNSDSTRQWRLNGNTRIDPNSQFIGTQDLSPISVRTNNIERMRIDDAGNIGVGQPQPTEKLEIRNGNILLSNSGVAGALVFQSSGDSTGGRSNSFTTSFRAGQLTDNLEYLLPVTAGKPSDVLTITGVAGPTTTLAWQPTGTLQWGVQGNAGTNSNANFFGTSDNAAVSFRTNNVEVMTITPPLIGTTTIPGNVGVGTSVPRSRLSVTGNIRIGSPSPGSASTRLQAMEPPMAVNGVTDGLIFSGGGIASPLTASEDNSDPIWMARANTATDKSELRIAIGNDADLSNTNDQADLFNVGALNSSSPYLFQSRLAVLSNGNIGLGTTNPHAGLEIANGNLLLGRSANTMLPSQLQFQGLQGKTSFQAGAQSTDIQYILPATIGLQNQTLTIASVNGPTANLAWASPLGGGAWFLNGNSGINSATTFLGTTDTNDLVFRVNNLQALRLHPTSTIANITGGGAANGISNAAYGSAIVTGGGSTALAADSISSNRSIIGGGFQQVIGRSATDAENSGIVAGHSNTVLSTNGFIGAGWSNSIAQSSEAAAVMSGANNAVMNGSPMSSVLSGSYDSVAAGQSAIIAGQFNYAGGANSVIGSGLNNRLTGDYSAIVGGRYNVALNRSSFIGGGESNRVQGIASAIAGGQGNTTFGNMSSIPGGQGLTLAGARSFGYNANNAQGTGSIYISDSSVAVIANADLWLANSDNTAHQLRLYGAQSGSTIFPATTTHYTSLQAGNSTANISYTLPTSGPTQNGNLLLASSGVTSSWAWTNGLAWDNTNGRLGVNVASPLHSIHSITTSTSDESAAIYGGATASTTLQAIGVWGAATSSASANTGTIGVLASGNSNTQAGHTNVALQVTDGELAIGRTSELTTNATIAEPGSSGSSYSGEGPSGVIELALGSGGNLVTAAPVANTMQDLGMINVVNRYCQTGSIVLINVVGLVEDNSQGPKARDAAFMLSVDNTAPGSFGVRIKMIPGQSNSNNYSTGTKIRLGYLIVNKSR